MGIFLSFSFVANSCINLKAIGLTAFPEYPDTEDFPLTMGSPINLLRSIPVILLTVLIADIPVAPPSIEAIAGNDILPIFGVILARNGREVPCLTAWQYFFTSSGFWPTSEPIAWLVI